MGHFKTKEDFLYDIKVDWHGDYSLVSDYVDYNSEVTMYHRNCGRTFEITPKQFNARKRPCSRCYPKWDFETFKTRFEIENPEYKILTSATHAKEYITVKHLSCGSEYSVWVCNLDRGDRCPTCMSRKRTTEDFKQLVYSLEGDNYIVVDEYINTDTPIKMKHNVEGCGYEYFIVPHNFLAGRRCSNCADASRRLTSKDYQNRLDIKFGKDNYILLSDYRTSKDSVTIRHNKCGHIWETLPFNLTRKDAKCPNCLSNNKYTHSDFLDLVHYKFKDEYTILSTYTSSKNPVEVRHNLCGKVFTARRAEDFLSGQRRCSFCYAHSSKGERALIALFSALGVNFRREYSFPELLGIGGFPLRFDFAVFDESESQLEFLVEYDGEYHFEQKNGNLEYQQEHDRRKNEFCYKNNIKLYRFTKDNLEAIKQMAYNVRLSKLKSKT